MSRTQNLTAVGINDYLRFERVLPALAAVVKLLFFWGRSIGDSITSTSIKLNSDPGWLKRVLPGS